MVEGDWLDRWLFAHALELVIGSMGVTAVGMLLAPFMALFLPTGIVAVIGGFGCFLSSVNLLFVTMTRSRERQRREQ